MAAIGQMGEPTDFAKWSYCQNKTVAYLMCYFNMYIYAILYVHVVYLNRKMYVILFSFYNHIQCILMTSTLTVSFQPPSQSLNT